MKTFLCFVIGFASLWALGVGAQSLTPPAVTFSNFVKSPTKGCTSFNVNFVQPVYQLTTAHLRLANATNTAFSLSGAVLTPQSGYLVWNVSKAAGFNPAQPNAVLTATFTNAPASICSAPVSLVSVSKPTTVVGTGTPSSCTEAAFTTAIARGGIITFSCGSLPVTITVSSVKNVNLNNNTIIDGKGLITLSGNGVTRILAIQTTYDKVLPRVTLQNLAFTNGYTTDVVNTKATNTGGGALYRLGGAFTIINCDFSNNQGPINGQDVAGGAVYSIGGADTTIAGSTFSGNKCSNGGAIGNLGNSFAIFNSVVNNNNASGTGANPGNGGNAGAISFDGQGVTSTICGCTFSNNTAGALGGAIFRVGYTLNDVISISSSTFAYNSAVSQAGAIYVQGLSVVITNTTIMYNSAQGTGGLALQYQSSYQLSGVTVANNTATSSLGGGIGINSGNGTISDSTIIGNNAPGPYAFDGGIAGGDSKTILTRSIVAYNTEGNIWNPLNCGSTLSDGGGNIQFPQIRASGQSDTPCSANVLFADPQLKSVANNGCVTWTALPIATGPATQAGARCKSGQTSPVLVTLYASGSAVPRGAFTGSG